MDMGDIVRLLFLAFIFLSFFGGLFGRNREGQEQQGRAPRPTDVFESGGQDRPRPQRQPQSPAQPQRPPQERQMPTTATQWWEELTGNRTQPEPRPQPQPQRREPERQVATRDDSVSRGEAQRVEHQRQRREQATVAGRQSVREGERQMLEQDITDMPEPMELYPRRRRDREIGATAQRRSRRTGGDVLRRSMRKPETLERAFILKEVLDEPLALRERRQQTYG
jgi:hypothetical protein